MLGEHYTAPAFPGGMVPYSPENFSPEALTGLPGFSRVNKVRRASTMVKVAECSSIWNKFLKGDVPRFLMQEAMNPTHDFVFSKLQKLAPHIFHEAMTRSDFLNLTTYVLDRLMFDNYPKVPKTYDQCCKLHENVKDFRVVERWQTDNGEGVWQKVGETSNFNRTKEDTGKYTYQVYKYEKGAQVSWEAYVNDDMSQFKDLPVRLQEGGVRTIEQFWLNLIADTNGPHASFFGNAIALVTGGTIKNIIDLSPYSTGTFTGVRNPPLTVVDLILAVGLFMNQMTSEGRPIDIGSDQLNVVVADGVLFQTLKQIINTNQIATTVLGGSKASNAVTADMTLMSRNWLTANINPIYAPELRNIITGTPANAATSWWLFAKPGTARPAVELGFLDGYSRPTLYKKRADTLAMSGGEIDEFGSFETMSTELKGLVVFGGTRMDPRMAMASNGTGS